MASDKKQSDASRAERMRRILNASNFDRDANYSAGSNQEQRIAHTFARAEDEDDDGYDPYSDRPAPREGLERDPWR